MDDRIDEVQEMSQQTLAMSKHSQAVDEECIADHQPMEAKKPSWAVSALKSVISAPYRLISGNAVKKADNTLVDNRLSRE